MFQVIEWHEPIFLTNDLVFRCQNITTSLSNWLHPKRPEIKFTIEFTAMEIVILIIFNFFTSSAIDCDGLAAMYYFSPPKKIIMVWILSLLLLWGL